MRYENRLDASEVIWLRRQLEAIDETDYQNLYPDNLSRTYIPTQQGIPEWANVYTWQMFDKVGRAKIIGAHSDDLPRVDAIGREQSKIIKELGASYAWTVKEIKRAAATGVDLDRLRAFACRHSIDTEIDFILANGVTSHGLEGLLTLTGANTATPVVKTGGGTTWTMDGNPDEIAADLFAIVTKAQVDMLQAKGPVFTKMVVLVPVEKYAILMQKRMGDGSDNSILSHVLKNCPWIEAVEPWRHCKNAGSGGAIDRMVAYVRNPLVVAAILPQEYTEMTPEQRNLEMLVNATASIGGVVARYLFAIVYMDGI